MKIKLGKSGNVLGACEMFLLFTRGRREGTNVKANNLLLNSFTIYNTVTMY